MMVMIVTMSGMSAGSFVLRMPSTFKNWESSNPLPSSSSEGGGDDGGKGGAGGAAGSVQHWWKHCRGTSDGRPRVAVGCATCYEAGTSRHSSAVRPGHGSWCGQTCLPSRPTQPQSHGASGGGGDGGGAGQQ